MLVDTYTFFLFFSFYFEPLIHFTRALHSLKKQFPCEYGSAGLVCFVISVYTLSFGGSLKRAVLHQAVMLSWAQRNLAMSETWHLKCLFLIILCTLIILSSVPEDNQSKTRS